jgi:thiaminase (transcriptional activator TenA)
MTDRFTDELWRGAADIYDAILAHPFFAGLTDGSLEQDAFVFYVVQDAIYLRAYAQALAAVASRAPDTAGTEMFARHAAEIVTVERTLHDSLLADLGIDPASADEAEPAPTTLAYVSYLLATTRGGSYAEGASAVLLDLLGGGQGTAPARLTQPALPAVDRHLRRRGIRRHRA